MQNILIFDISMGIAEGTGIIRNVPSEYRVKYQAMIANWPSIEAGFSLAAAFAGNFVTYCEKGTSPFEIKHLKIKDHPSVPALV